MTPRAVKEFLDGFVPEHERNFRVRFSRRASRRRRASYSVMTRTITIYANGALSVPELLAAALHELAHHVVWSAKHEELFERLRQGRRIPQHGSDFKAALDALLRRCNQRYRKAFGGRLVYDRRRPRVAPWVVSR